MKAFYLFFAPLIFSSVLRAQTISGYIKDAKTAGPLEYVNIGVVNRNIGTVSNDEGKFSLTIPEANNADTVRISMLGYSPRLFIVSDLRKQMAADKTVSLQPSSFRLADVIVSPKNLKEKVLGNVTQSQSTTAGFTSSKLGNEIGIIIKIKKSPTYLRSFTASTVAKDGQPVKLRLNFYSVRNGLPDKLLQDKNIIADAPVKNGKLMVDLRPYNLVVEDDFFVSLECIESASRQIMFSASLFGSPLIARETSQGNWEKLGLFGIGYTVKVAY